MNEPAAPVISSTEAARSRRWRFAWPAATWHNIFYDLAFVAIIVVLSTSLGNDSSFSHTLWLVIAFVELWLIWLITSIVERGLPVGFWRVFIVAAQMAALLIAAMAADTTIEDTSILFGLFIGLATVLVFALDLASRDRVLTKVDRVLLVVAAACSTFGTFQLGDAWWVLWSFNLVLLTIVAVRLVRTKRRTVGEHVRHRLGEFTLIVLGESFVKVALIADQLPVSEFSIVAMLLVFVLITTLWWGYFTVPCGAQVLEGGRPSTRFVFAHLVFHMGVIGLAVGLSKLITDLEKLDKGAVGGLVLAPIALAVLALAAMTVWRAHWRIPVSYGIVGLGVLALAVWAAQASGVDSRLLTSLSAAAVLAVTAVSAARRGEPDPGVAPPGESEAH